ncbi:hypothetical protein TNCV_4083251 [Trichonephila clavipes]|nr:hypothetical protein TNCV_4083251 [Trichonephila clavipes]
MRLLSHQPYRSSKNRSYDIKCCFISVDELIHDKSVGTQRAYVDGVWKFGEWNSSLGVILVNIPWLNTIGGGLYGGINPFIENFGNQMLFPFPLMMDRKGQMMRAGLSTGRPEIQGLEELDLTRLYGYKFRSSSAKEARRSAPKARKELKPVLV